ncbi:hypothetical protein [Streptomyces roseolus]|uniref:hypothetical protein n=1 Tax=Streptomyces roseolus TaxID=67358 RepID=UPI003651C42B
MALVIEGSTYTERAEPEGSAILTILGGVDAPAADRLLTDARGHLREALAAARPGSTT